MVTPTSSSVAAGGASASGAADASTSSSSGEVLVLAKRYISFDIMGAIVQRLTFYYNKTKSFVYDTVILRMTEQWYRAVLSRMDDGSILLDVGIGTGGIYQFCIHGLMI